MAIDIPGLRLGGDTGCHVLFWNEVTHRFYRCANRATGQTGMTTWGGKRGDLWPRPACGTHIRQRELYPDSVEPMTVAMGLGITKTGRD